VRGVSGGLGKGDQGVATMHALVSERVEFPDLQVVIERGCGKYKHYGTCVSVRYILESILSDRKRKIWKGDGRFYWPSKGNVVVQRLLLLLLADVYPQPLSIVELRELFKQYGIEVKSLKQLLYQYYHYHGLVERVGHGLYKLQDWYYEALNDRKPYWRAILDCMSKSLANNDYKSLSACNSIVRAVKDAIEVFIKLGSQRVAKGPKGSRKVAHSATLKRIKYDVEKNEESKISMQCSSNVNKILEVLKENKPVIYEELKSNPEDLGKAAELLAILYARAKQGRPYIVATSEPTLVAVLHQEARTLLGGGSSIVRTLDWEYSIRPVAELLRASGAIFSRRYGSDFKIRIDKDFERLLDRVLGCEG